MDERLTDLEQALQDGRIAQVPPRHAALKRDGRKYYEYARAGTEATLEPIPQRPGPKSSRK